MIQIESIQKIFQSFNELYTVHAQKRMAERKILSKEIREAVLSNFSEIIEN